MNLEIHTRNLRLSDLVQSHAEKRLGRLDRYLPNITQVRLDLAMEHSKRTGDHPVAQLTVRNQRGTLLRSEVKDQPDLIASIDAVVDKMFRQIERYKGKRKSRASLTDLPMIEAEFADLEPLPPAPEDDLDTQVVVKRKQIELAPMNETEAIDQMELLGHTFFVFYNADVGAVNVVYRRENGGYGLLQPLVG
jgi:putative sigma-54 modulation protein